MKFVCPNLAAAVKYNSASRPFRIWDLVFIVLLAMVTYLCVRSSSFMIELPWFPRRAAEWADSSSHLPHTIAFFALALTGYLLRLPTRWVLPNLESRPMFVANSVFFVLLIVVLEMLQLWLPERTFSWLDIAAGWAGAGVAAATCLAAWLTGLRWQASSS